MATAPSCSDSTRSQRPRAAPTLRRRSLLPCPSRPAARLARVTVRCLGLRMATGQPPMRDSSRSRPRSMRRIVSGPISPASREEIRAPTVRNVRSSKANRRVRPSRAGSWPSHSENLAISFLRLPRRVIILTYVRDESVWTPPSRHPEGGPSGRTRPAQELRLINQRCSRDRASRWAAPHNSALRAASSGPCAWIQRS